MTSNDGRYDDNEFSHDSRWVEEVLERPKSASKALRAYIEQFEGERTPKATRNGCYARTVSTLLSSKPKSASPAAATTLKDLSNTSGDMVENLVDWVKASYTKDLHRKILPYGSGLSTSSRDERKLRLSELEETDNSDNDNRSVWSDPGVELSTLPSPGSSVAADIEAESVSTDMLVESFYKTERSKFGSAPYTRNYPSWVEDVATQSNYPSWVDEMDKTQVTHNGSFNARLHNQKNVESLAKTNVGRLIKARLCRSLSPSFSHHRSNPEKSPPSFLSTSPKYQHHESVKKSWMTENEAWELESINTEVLISQPIYGQQPVNMGGSLHSSLYKDKKIQQLHEQSLRKTVKRSPRTPTSKDKSSTKSPAHHEQTSHAANSLLRSMPVANAGVTQSPRSRQKPFKAMKNLKERKISVDSNNTDKLMRQSPTGIRMVKQVKSKGKSNNVIRPNPKETPNGRVIFRRNASQELTNRLESAEKHSVKPGIFTRVNDPRTFKSSVRNTPRPVPLLRTTSVPELVAERLKRSSLVDRRKDHTVSEPHRNGILETNPRYYSRNQLDSGGRIHEGTDSTNTEGLVIQPPMPLFDASPSLTTETASTVCSVETTIGLLEQEALKTSFLAEQSDLLASSSKTSYMELVRSPGERRTPMAATGEPRLFWEEDHSYEKEAHSYTKPGIISSFLEDCIRSSEESRLDEEVNLSSYREESVSDASERPVETLKKMLFTVQGLAQETEDEGRSDDEIRSENYATRSETPIEEMTSVAMSNETPNADNSLSRAYYHLARLKKLVSVSERVAGLK